MQSEQGVLLLLCIIMALLLGALVRFLVQGTRVPYSVALLVIGLALGSLERFVISPDAWPQLDAAFGVLTHLDPHLILFIFLPTLIFEHEMGSRIISGRIQKWKEGQKVRFFRDKKAGLVAICLPRIVGA